MPYWKYKKMEEVLEIGIPKEIDMKIHKTFDLSILSLVINTMKTPVQVHKHLSGRVVIAILSWWQLEVQIPIHLGIIK